MPCLALGPVLYLESAEDGSHSAVQGVPAPVAFVDHGFELAGSVSAVLSGQAAVLVIDQFQVGQPLINLPLETLKRTGEEGMTHGFRAIKTYNGIINTRSCLCHYVFFLVLQCDLTSFFS